MAPVTNSYSYNSSVNSAAKPSTEAKAPEKETSLWESFCDEVIAPALEDATYSYIDENYGTNLVQTKEQMELEKTYEEVLAKEVQNSNKSLEDITSDILSDILTDSFNNYCDTNFDTNLAEQKEQKAQEDAKLLQEAKDYKAQEDAKQAAKQEAKTNFLFDLLGLIFNPKKD